MDLQAQRILSDPTIPARARSIRCVQDRRPRRVQSGDVKVDTPVSVARRESIRVMRRVKGGHDCIFRVSDAPSDGDGVVGDEERRNVREGRVPVAEDVDEREAKLRRLYTHWLFASETREFRSPTDAEIGNGETGR